MILVDTNVFLRLLAHPATPEDQAMAEIARELFDAVERGDTEVTTTAVVLHEVAYMLAGRGHYAHPVEHVVTSMATLLQLPGFRLPNEERQRYLRALALWQEHPTLGFSDALLVVTALERGLDLASFDHHFERIPGLRRWTP